MAKLPLPTPEELRQLLRYEPETGKLFWRERGLKFFRPHKYGNAHSTWNNKYAGREITSKSTHGYIRIRIFDNAIAAHRAAWCIIHGEWPTSCIDHISGDRTDNRIANLRLVTNQENSKNVRQQKHNTSGITGVGWHSRAKRWRAYVNHKSKHYQIGLFDTKEDAAIAVKKKRTELGFSERHGLP